MPNNAEILTDIRNKLQTSCLIVERVAEGKTNYGASTKPLVDSGTLLRSVTHLVK